MPNEYNSRGNESGGQSSEGTTPIYKTYDTPPHEGDILKKRCEPKLVSVPKRILREEIVEDMVLVDETIVEVANKIYQQKYVEVPEVEYVENIKEVVDRRIEEKVIEVPKIEYCERIIEVPKYVTHERYSVVPQVEYRDVITERVIEVPEIHQDFIIKETPIPQYVDENNQKVPRPIIEIERKIPVPVEAVTTYGYQLAQFKPRVTKKKFPILVPRFVPKPVIAQKIPSLKLNQMQNIVQSVCQLVGPQALSLNEIDELAKSINDAKLDESLPDNEEAQKIIQEKWLTGQLQVTAGSA